MAQFKTYLFSYNHDGARWSFEMEAKDKDDAIARVNRLAFATYDGEVKMRIPVGPTSWWQAAADWLTKRRGR